MAAMAGVDGDGDGDATGRGKTESVIAAQDIRWRTPSSQKCFPPETQIIPATTYFPERLPSQYLRRWRA